MKPLTQDELANLHERVRRILGAQYDRIEFHRAGGMGVVYTGTNRRLARREAIKVLFLRTGDDRTALDRFESEWRALAALEHPHIITIYNAGHDPSAGIAWMSQAFIEGGTLSEKLRYGPLPLNEGVRIALGVITGLAHAHQNGILHRDLKPENVLLDASGGALLADFGIAAMSTPGVGSADTSRVGTPSYMSPEQLLGQPLDPRSDLYAFGILIYEIFTGRNPFADADPEGTAYRQINEQPRSPGAFRPDLPDEICRLTLDLLAKEPGRRPPTAEVVRQRLQAIAGPAGRSVRLRGWRARLVMVGGLVALVVLLVLGQSWLARQLPPRQTEVREDRSGGDQMMEGGEIDLLGDAPTVARSAVLDSTRADSDSPRPAPVRVGRSYIRVQLTGTIEDRRAAQRSRVRLDDRLQATSAPGLLVHDGRAGEPVRVALELAGFEFEPAESVLTVPKPGDTLKIDFRVARTGRYTW